MGLEHDAPPHSHMEVPFTYEMEAGCVGPSADGAQTNDPDFGAQGFDEDAWFEAQAERLRQRNQQQSMEVIAPTFQCEALCAPLVCFYFRTCPSPPSGCHRSASTWGEQGNAHTATYLCEAECAC